MDHHYTLAGTSDVDAVLGMMREYYAYDHLLFRPEVARRRLRGWSMILPSALSG